MVSDLCVAVKQRRDVSTFVPSLLELLRNGEESLKADALFVLISAAEKGVDISKEVPLFIDLLKSKDGVTVHNAMGALRMSAEQGANISAAVPSLEKLLKNPFDYNRSSAQQALEAFTIQQSMSKNVQPDIRPSSGMSNPKQPVVSGQTLFI